MNTYQLCIAVVCGGCMVYVLRTQSLPGFAAVQQPSIAGDRGWHCRRVPALPALWVVGERVGTVDGWARVPALDIGHCGSSARSPALWVRVVCT